MENYYFTFGSNHNKTDGTPLKDYWVRVIADSYGEARDLFIEKFTSIYMDAKDKFAFQYDDKSFEKHYFRKGEYAVISADNKSSVTIENKNCDHYYIPTNSKWGGEHERYCIHCNDVIK